MSRMVFPVSANEIQNLIRESEADELLFFIEEKKEGMVMTIAGTKERIGKMDSKILCVKPLEGIDNAEA